MDFSIYSFLLGILAMGILQNFYRQYPIDRRVIIANMCKNVESKLPTNETEQEMEQTMINKARGL